MCKLICVIEKKALLILCIVMGAGNGYAGWPPINGPAKQLHFISRQISMCDSNTMTTAGRYAVRSQRITNEKQVSENTGAHVSEKNRKEAVTGKGSLRFTDTTYIDLGNSSGLQLTNFTLEAWIKIEGYGSTTETGTGGLAGVVPIISKGGSDGETPEKDMNYFLGYEPGTNKLVADFEDAASVNHPVISNAAVLANKWTHVGASFDVGTNTWRLFIGESIESFILPGAAVPQFASTVNACIGSTEGTIIPPARAGYFNGRIDEVRIWNVALTSLNAGELPGGAGLAGRWGLNESTGTAALNSVAGGADGIIINDHEWVTGFNESDYTTNSCIDLNGAHDYITYGPAPSLNTTPASTGFTLEAWIKIEGDGITATTGTGGLPGAVPIISKGADEGDFPSTANINYFFGINSSRFLVADFEEAAGANTGANHPVTGSAAVNINVWTHVAATYNIPDGVWTLYVNGNIAGTGNAGAGVVPEYASGGHAAIGTTLTSTGAPFGFFNGKIDEVRIWDRALSATELQRNSCAALTAVAGLLGRWEFNENGGITAANGLSAGISGSLMSNNISTHPTNGGPSWSGNSLGEYRSKNTNGAWSNASDWEMFDGAIWSAALKPPSVTDNVTIMPGSVYTISGPVYCHDLTVSSAAKLYRNAVANTYVNVYGNIICDGTIGNGLIPDGISFNIEGAVCSISGSGTFDCSRIKKSCDFHTATNLIFNRDVNLRYNGTALFNDASSTYFNIEIAQNATVSCLGDGTANGSGSVSIDGTNGADFGYNAGSLTVNGTLHLSGNGSPTLYASTNNTNALWPVSVIIGKTGVINTGVMNCPPSGPATHTFMIMNGGKLNITGEPATYTAPSTINNNYVLQAGSIVEYSAAGDQTVYTFGSVNYSNLFGSGGGIKKIIAPLGVTDTLKISGTATLASDGNLTLLSTAIKTAMVAELPVDASGHPLADVTGDVTVERYISKRRAWRFLSVPTNTTQSVKAAWQEGATSSADNPSPGYGTQITDHVIPTAANGFDYDSPAGPSVKKYDAAATGMYAPYKQITTTFDPIATKEGIMAFVRGDRTAVGLGAVPTSTVLRTTGPLFTGTQAAIPVAANQFASIGNPYASPVDMRKISRSEGVNNNYYLWDPMLAGSGFGAFQTFVLEGTDYMPTPGGGSYPFQSGGPMTVPYNYIQSGMAFFTDANGTTGGNVTLTESAKVNTGADVGATALRPDAVPLPNPMLRVNLYGMDADTSCNLVDGVLFSFGNYSNAADRMDARKMRNVGENLAIERDSALLSVEKRSLPLKEDTLKLNMYNMKIKRYRLQIWAKNFDVPHFRAVLEDHYLNTSTLIDMNETTLYNFDITEAGGSWNASRFSIVFKQQHITPAPSVRLKAYPLHRYIGVDWEVKNDLNVLHYTVEKSPDGKAFTAMAVKAATPPGSLKNYRCTDKHPAAGTNYYRIRSNDFNGEAQYSETVKVTVEETGPQIRVFPNPVHNGLISLQFQKQAPGNYSLRLLNKHGQAVTHKNLWYLPGSYPDKLSVKTPSTVGHGVYNLEIRKPDGDVVHIQLLL